MISLILWLLFGALVGWLASIVMKTNGQQGALLNIVVGIVGAFIGGFIINREVAPSVFSLPSLLTAFLGAVILLGIYNMATRGRVR
ncbi:MAG: GlsB/YeaQ/YmgE family stress response membrane protein [Herpetosiphonaceae bacterium]|nr:GlsB/YeaQ/YmgE family stress response membrane protein [Herpetosiphonaceae bacterium]